MDKSRCLSIHCANMDDKQAIYFCYGNKYDKWSVPIIFCYRDLASCNYTLHIYKFDECFTHEKKNVTTTTNIFDCSTIFHWSSHFGGFFRAWRRCISISLIIFVLFTCYFFISCKWKKMKPYKRRVIENGIKVPHTYERFAYYTD